MVQTAINSTPLEDREDECDNPTWSEQFSDWMHTELIWYASSFTFHLLALCGLLLLGSRAARIVVDAEPNILTSQTVEAAKPGPDIDASGEEPQPPPAEKPDDPPPPAENRQPQSGGLIEIKFDNQKEFVPGGNHTPFVIPGPPDGSRGAFSVTAVGPGARLRGPGGAGDDWNSNKPFAWRGPGDGPGHGSQHRRMLSGITVPEEFAVLRALDWLARHQLPDGNWSLRNYTHRCTDASCSGPGSVEADAAATAMGLLPFLAHGETHKNYGKHVHVITNGLVWLVRHQKPDGDLSAGADQQMYAHALATITLCEAYGMTLDNHVKVAAQAAVDFIVAAQNRQTGGWRYHPGDEGDTSVLGWQIMALRSAQLAGLKVALPTMDAAGKFLDSVGQGYHGAQYSYQPGGGSTPAMTAVGLLCRQYLGAKRDDPLMADGTAYLLAHLPEASLHNLYYWYYATMVMHNIDHEPWDVWNRKMRRLFVDTQNVDPKRCARGSWDPNGPTKDQWGDHGGRLMMTSLSALTLEVYYRYLPLYALDGRPAVPGTVAEPK